MSASITLLAGWTGDWQPVPVALSMSATTFDTFSNLTISMQTDRLPHEVCFRGEASDYAKFKRAADAFNAVMSEAPALAEAAE